jgi:hypothetical protein
MLQTLAPKHSVTSFKPADHNARNKTYKYDLAITRYILGNGLIALIGLNHLGLGGAGKGLLVTGGNADISLFLSDLIIPISTSCSCLSPYGFTIVSLYSGEKGFDMLSLWLCPGLAV